MGHPAWNRLVNDADVRKAAQDIAAGISTLADIARRCGITAQVLGRRIHRLGLSTTRRVRGPKRRRDLRLVYRADCPRCGLRVEASQTGDTSDGAWRGWLAHAERHGEGLHGMSHAAATRWALDWWDEVGVREVQVADPHGRKVQAAR